MGTAKLHRSILHSDRTYDNLKVVRLFLPRSLTAQVFVCHNEKHGGWIRQHLFTKGVTGYRKDREGGRQCRQGRWPISPYSIHWSVRERHYYVHKCVRMGDQVMQASEANQERTS